MSSSSFGAGMSESERRIAYAVSAELRQVFQTAFSEFEVRQNTRFVDHMEEIERYYSARDAARDEEMRNMRAP